VKKLLFILTLLLSVNLFGQGFTYSYVDPCSKLTKTIFISGNQSVTVNYLGFISSFTQTDFSNGNFDNWISQIQVQAANQPCDEMLTQTQTTQNSIITQNLISTLTSITAASTMSVTSVGSSISNSVDNASSNNSPSSRRGSNNNKNGTTTNQSNNTSSGSVSSSSATTNGGTQSGTNTGGSQPSGGGNNTQGEGTNQNGGNSSGSGNSTEGGSGQTQPSVNTPPSNPPSNPPSSNTGSSTQSGTNTGQGGGGNTQSGTNPTDGPKQENTGGGAGGTTNSVANAAEATSSSSSSSSGGSKVRVGSLIGTGDIVAIRSAEDKSNQFKGTMSMTKSNTNNTFAKGFLLNFTTTINNTSLTFYGARSNKAKTNTFIFANSSMIDFERNFFNTTTVMDSKRFGKLSMMGGLNFTAGGLAGELFGNLSAVGGGFYPFKVGKKLTGNMLMLGVYSPFTQFYEGKWWDSGVLLVPFSSWDYTISKSFKYNISFSGTYQVNGNVLNYQILTGGKILL
jgi:hypothetical protein